MIRITMRFPEDIHKTLTELSEKERRSFNSQVLHMIDVAMGAPVRAIVQDSVRDSAEDIVDQPNLPTEESKKAYFCPNCARKYPDHHITCPNNPDHVTTNSGLSIQEIIRANKT